MWMMMMLTAMTLIPVLIMMVLAAKEIMTVKMTRYARIVEDTSKPDRTKNVRKSARAHYIVNVFVCLR